MNDACCSRPIVSASYEPVGKHETLKDGMKVYVTGPATATRAIIYIYDAFGYTQQQLMGADMLSSSLKARVYMPDFFRGNGLPHDTFPMNTDEKKERVQKFFTGPGAFGIAADLIPSIITELSPQVPSVKKWGAIGFCWGGKVSAVASVKGAPLNVSAACHPGRMDPEEAKAFKIPHVCLLSGEDGTEEEKKAYEKALGENGQDVHYEVFQDQVHGWMAARADLSSERVKAEYERGYDTVSKFFEKYL